MLAPEASCPEPKFKQEPTQLSNEARILLDELRTEHISIHANYRRDGYTVVGGISQFDAWMLRAGEILNLMAVRRSVGERMRKKLEEKFTKRGQAVDVRHEVGAVFVKHGVRQKDVMSKKDFSIHPRGLTFYMRNQEPAASFQTAQEMVPLGRSMSFSRRPQVAVSV